MMETVNLSNIGIVKSKASSELMAVVGAEVLKIQLDFSKAVAKNQTLAGNILHEYQLVDCCSALEIKTREMAQMHQEVYGENYTVGLNAHTNILEDGKKPNLKLKSAWVNFQQRGEFNPIHNHTGMYSFVLWYKIPYYSNLEESAGPGRKSKNRLSGKFQFHYTDILGNITGAALPIDKQWEGQILLFPSLLNHSVFPFYSSNDYRISIAGNLFLVQEDQ
jgi:hypothetical protein